MATIRIMHRKNPDRVVAAVEAESVKDAIEKLVARGKDLEGADLAGADLAGADLAGAKLAGAKLAGANLYGAILPTGVTFEHFRDVVVPKLLTATGMSIADVLATGCWKCHEWSNCPMHAVFGVGHLDGIPVEWRPHASLFITLFDSGHIPEPKVS